MKFFEGDRVKLIERIHSCGFDYRRPAGSKATVLPHEPWDTKDAWVFITWDKDVRDAPGDGGYFPESFALVTKDTFDQDNEE